METLNLIIVILSAFFIIWLIYLPFYKNKNNRKKKKLSTKIEIEYNVAYAICKVNGKYFTECDSFTKAIALGAFRCIEQDNYRRTNNGNCSPHL